MLSFMRVAPAARFARTRLFASANLTARKYSKDHEWVKVDGKVATVGITDFAQAALGDVVFADLPEVGRSLASGESFGSVESVKAASDVYSPISGKVTEVNSKLKDEPSLLNKSPYDDAWLVKLNISNEQDLSKLMDHAAYEKHCADNKH
jgi:glycine cleavage system H protein